MWVAAVALLSACAGRAPETVEPGVAERVTTATAPDRPLRVVFRWRVLDGEVRFTGQGAARIGPEYHARLDLFGPRGEHYLSAAIVGSDLSVPENGRGVLPPPAMVWSVLGVVRPPDEATLQGTRRTDDGTELHYAVGESRLRYGLEDGRLRSVEWRGDGRRMVVELNGEVDGLPASAEYRDWANNTELHIELETVEDVEPYPSEIWTPR